MVARAKEVVLYLRERVERSIQQQTKRGGVPNQVFYEVMEQLLFLQYADMPFSAIKE